MISDSTLKRIKTQKDFLADKESKVKQKVCMKILKSKLMKKAVMRYAYSQELPFRSIEVCSYLLKEFWVEVDHRLTAKFMREELHMSFKKASSRPLKLDTKRQHQLMILFVVLLVELLEGSKWIVNIDESTLSSLTKADYTWGLRGVPAVTKNMRFIGSLNIISAISTTGYSYSTILTETNRSIIFIQFLKQLMKDIKQREGIRAHEILIVMNNSQVHQAKVVVVIKYLESWKVRYLFLPQYSPELAPVELYFGIFKQRILRTKAKTLNLQKVEGINEVADELEKISTETVKKLRKHVHEKYKLLINSIHEI